MAELFGNLGETKALFLAADTDPIHRANVTLAAGEGILPAGAVLAKDGDGKYILANSTSGAGGTPGTPAVAGSRMYTVKTNLADGDVLTFDTVSLTAKTAAGTGAFVIGADTAGTAKALSDALNGQNALTDLYVIAVNGAAVTFTEKAAGGGHTPPDVTGTGAAKITMGTATVSKAAVPGIPAADGAMGSVILANDTDITAETVANVYISGAFIAEHLTVAEGDTVDAHGESLYAHNIRLVHEN